MMRRPGRGADPGSNLLVPLCNIAFDEMTDQKTWKEHVKAAREDIEAADQQEPNPDDCRAPGTLPTITISQSQEQGDHRHQCESCPNHARDQCGASIHPAASQLVDQTTEHIPKIIKESKFNGLAGVVAWIQRRHTCSRDRIDDGGAGGVVVSNDVEIEPMAPLYIDQQEGRKEEPDGDDDEGTPHQACIHCSPGENRKCVSRVQQNEPEDCHKPKHQNESKVPGNDSICQKK